MKLAVRKDGECRGLRLERAQEYWISLRWICRPEGPPFVSTETVKNSGHKPQFWCLDSYLRKVCHFQLHSTKAFRVTSIGLKSQTTGFPVAVFLILSTRVGVAPLALKCIFIQFLPVFLSTGTSSLATQGATSVKCPRNQRRCTSST